MLTVKRARPCLPHLPGSVHWWLKPIQISKDRSPDPSFPQWTISRWQLISCLGGIEVLLGFAAWLGLNPIHDLLWRLEWLLTQVTAGLPNALSGTMLLVMGLMTLVVRGQQPGKQVIVPLCIPASPSQLTEYSDSSNQPHGPKIVALGGGTGLSSLLRGLKVYSNQITAVVTIADDGGSSGRLRQTFGIQAPGDLRNCLAALAAEDTLLTQLFQYRFEAGEGLAGHSLGNLFLTAMTHLTGDLERAATASAGVLATRGRVLPATLSDMHLWAELADGRFIQGESAIAAAGGQISRIGCLPEAPTALPAVLEAIAAADYIILGPGSLYTSILPNLLVPEIRQAIAQATVPRIYVCNIMTQPGETTAYSVADHLLALDRVCGQRVFDQVVAHQGRLSPQMLSYYAQSQSYPVPLNVSAVASLGCQLITGNVADETSDQGISHHPARLAHLLIQEMQAAVRLAT